MENKIDLQNVLIILFVILLPKHEAVKDGLSNHKEHKEGTKDTKLKSYITALCDLCANPL